MKIALDAMGGDHAPGATVSGAVNFVNVCKDTDTRNIPSPG
jgi:fatty acid/phospholipid biosynthesis enzyme